MGALIEGYVVKIENERFLVVDPLPQDYSSTGGMREFFDAIWFSNVPKDIRVGQKVQVWFHNVATSYPGQSRAEKVSILPDHHPVKANLSGSEAIRKSLESEKLKETDIPLIKAVNYNPETDIWTIQIKQGKDEVNVQVKD